MKPSILPPRINLMPREPTAGPPHSVRFLIARALSTIPYHWSGRMLAEESVPVDAVLEALKVGGWKIVPMTREDYDRG